MDIDYLIEELEGIINVMPTINEMSTEEEQAKREAKKEAIREEIIKKSEAIKNLQTKLADEHNYSMSSTGGTITTDEETQKDSKTNEKLIKMMHQRKTNLETMLEQKNATINEFISQSQEQINKLNSLDCTSTLENAMREEKIKIINEEIEKFKQNQESELENLKEAISDLQKGIDDIKGSSLKTAVAPVLLDHATMMSDQHELETTKKAINELLRELHEYDYDYKDELKKIVDSIKIGELSGDRISQALALFTDKLPHDFFEDGKNRKQQLSAEKTELEQEISELLSKIEAKKLEKDSPEMKEKVAKILLENKKTECTNGINKITELESKKRILQSDLRKQLNEDLEFKKLKNKLQNKLKRNQMFKLFRKKAIGKVEGLIADNDEKYAIHVEAYNKTINEISDINVEIASTRQNCSKLQTEINILDQDAPLSSELEEELKNELKPLEEAIDEEIRVLGEELAPKQESLNEKNAQIEKLSSVNVLDDLMELASKYEVKIYPVQSYEQAQSKLIEQVNSIYSELDKYAKKELSKIEKRIQRKHKKEIKTDKRQLKRIDREIAKNGWDYDKQNEAEELRKSIRLKEDTIRVDALNELDELTATEELARLNTLLTELKELQRSEIDEEKVRGR